MVPHLYISLILMFIVHKPKNVGIFLSLLARTLVGFYIKVSLCLFPLVGKQINNIFSSSLSYGTSCTAHVAENRITYFRSDAGNVLNSVCYRFLLNTIKKWTQEEGRRINQPKDFMSKINNKNNVFSFSLKIKSLVNINID